MAQTVLGLWDGHDAGIALVRDGVLELALSEERLSRKKRASGFPYLSLARCWSECNLDPAEVDVVAVPGRFGRLVQRAGDALYRASDPARDVLSLSSTLMRTLETGISRIPGLRELESLGSHGVLAARLRRLGVRAPITWVPHHDAHAWTARLVAPADDAMLVTMDGYGDGLAGTVDAFGPSREDFASPQHSVALVYGAVTTVLGFSEGD